MLCYNHVPWKHMGIGEQKPETDLNRFIFKKMCTNAAKGIELQCSREYGGAASIKDITTDQRINLPENILCESYLFTFGSLAVEPATGKRIREDLMLDKHEKESTEAFNAATHRWRLSMGIIDGGGGVNI